MFGRRRKEPTELTISNSELVAKLTKAGIQPIHARRTAGGGKEWVYALTSQVKRIAGHGTA